MAVSKTIKALGAAALLVSTFGPAASSPTPVRIGSGLVFRGAQNTPVKTGVVYECEPEGPDGPGIPCQFVRLKATRQIVECLGADGQVYACDIPKPKAARQVVYEYQPDGADGPGIPYVPGKKKAVRQVVEEYQPDGPGGPGIPFVPETKTIRQIVYECEGPNGEGILCIPVKRAHAARDFVDFCDSNDPGVDVPGFGTAPCIAPHHKPARQIHEECQGSFGQSVPCVPGKPSMAVRQIVEECEGPDGLAWACVEERHKAARQIVEECEEPNGLTWACVEERHVKAARQIVQECEGPDGHAWACIPATTLKARQIVQECEGPNGLAWACVEERRKAARQIVQECEGPNGLAWPCIPATTRKAARSATITTPVVTLTSATTTNGLSVRPGVKSSPPAVQTGTVDECTSTGSLAVPCQPVTNAAAKAAVVADTTAAGQSIPSAATAPLPPLVGVPTNSPFPVGASTPSFPTGTAPTLMKSPTHGPSAPEHPTISISESTPAAPTVTRKPDSLLPIAPSAASTPVLPTPVAAHQSPAPGSVSISSNGTSCHSNMSFATPKQHEHSSMTTVTGGAGTNTPVASHVSPKTGLVLTTTVVRSATLESASHSITWNSHLSYPTTKSTAAGAVLTTTVTTEAAATKITGTGSSLSLPSETALANLACQNYLIDCVGNSSAKAHVPLFTEDVIDSCVVKACSYKPVLNHKTVDACKVYAPFCLAAGLAPHGPTNSTASSTPRLTGIVSSIVASVTANPAFASTTAKSTVATVPPPAATPESSNSTAPCSTLTDEWVITALNFACTDYLVDCIRRESAKGCISNNTIHLCEVEACKYKPTFGGVKDKLCSYYVAFCEAVHPKAGPSSSSTLTLPLATTGGVSSITGKTSVAIVPTLATTTATSL